MRAPEGTGAAAAAWAASGAMSVSGPPSVRTGPPERLVDGIAALGARVTAAATAVGDPVDLDWLALLGERTALEGLGRGGEVSCGGSTRLLPTADGWIAVSLARPTDVDSIPAWLGDRSAPSPSWPPAPELWRAVETAVARRAGAELAERATLVSIPVGVVGERAPDPSGGVATTSFGTADRPVHRPLRVLDLSALWAGPLCASLLGLAGAEVAKVESATRPDGSRAGSPGLFRVLNGGARSVVFDLTTPGGRDDLSWLLRRADVVVESSRPRALEQMGIVAAEVLADDDGPQVWVSITGHGRASPRVALGDDAAAAGGLVLEAEGRPWFCADAAADPVSGVAAAAAALEALATSDRALVDVAMAGVAASLAGPPIPPSDGDIARPRARGPRGPLVAPGSDTSAILTGW